MEKQQEIVDEIGVGSSVVAKSGSRLAHPFIKSKEGFGGVVESISEDGLTAQVKFTVFGKESVQEYPVSDLELKYS